MKNPTLSKAIKKQNMKMLKAVVKQATDTYKSKRPKEPQIDTVYGNLPLSALFDKESKWQIITEAYISILANASNLDPKLDKEVEIAKLIATNPIIRNIVTNNITTNSIL